MREFSIGCGSVSEDEVIDERIEIHISISGKVLCSLATESVCDIRMNDSIKLTEDSSQLRRLNYIIHHHRQDEWYYVKISDNLNYRICNKRCFILVSLC